MLTKKVSHIIAAYLFLLCPSNEPRVCVGMKVLLPYYERSATTCDGKFFTEEWVSCSMDCHGRVKVCKGHNEEACASIATQVRPCHSCSGIRCGQERLDTEGGEGATDTDLSWPDKLVPSPKRALQDSSPRASESGAGLHPFESCLYDTDCGCTAGLTIFYRETEFEHSYLQEMF